MPRPDASPAFVTAIQSPYVRPGIFAMVTMVSGPVFVWSGVGAAGFKGNTYQGVGQFGMISNVEEGADVQARGIVLTLSGFDPTLLGDILSDYRQGLPAIVSFAVQDPTGAWQGITSWAGRTDMPTITCSGDTAAIAIAAESRLVEMNTSIERRYTASDQNVDFPNDRGFDFVNQIQSITVFWNRFPGNQNNFSVQGSSAG